MDVVPRHRIGIALRGILYAAGFVLLWAWLAVSVQPLDAGLPFSIPAVLRPAGMVVGLAGALLTVWCIGTFTTKGQGTPAPFDPPREFVTSGPYRYVRNPMYIGGLSVILGAGLALASPSIVVLAGVFGLSAHLFVVLYEEPALNRRFGASYTRYKASINRWLPRPAAPKGS